VTANTVINNMFRKYFERFAENIRPHKISWCSFKPNFLKKTWVEVIKPVNDFSIKTSRKGRQLLVFSSLVKTIFL